jgi:peptidoglycan/LPS O-acetylase OafA/YrhL
VHISASQTDSSVTNNLPYQPSAAKKDIPNNHFEWIDILRGLAAAGVVLFHSRVDLWVGWRLIRLHPENYSLADKLIAWLSLPLPFLGSGVMLFFILSGFVIYYPKAFKKDIDVKSYAIRRFFRIVPPYLMAVLFSLAIEEICKYCFGPQISRPQVIWRSFFMIQNYPPHPAQLSSNPSLWSLPVEVELYILFPILFFLSNHIGKRATLFGVGLFTLTGIILTFNFAAFRFEFFLNYWIIWCSGSLLAYLVRHGKLPQWRPYNSLYLLLAFAAAIVVVLKIDFAPIVHITWAIAYLFLLWFVLTLRPPGEILKKIPLKILIWLGKISYSLYLIHFPFFYLMGKLWIAIYGHKPANLLICFVFSILAMLFAWGFYMVIEKPAHILARRLGKSAG